MQPVMTTSTTKNEMFVSLTNIPTPYRIHFYRILEQMLAVHGIDLQVWFMAHSEPGRHWQLDSQTFGFSHRFSRGIHPIIHDREFHFNPALILSVLRHRPKWLLLSGSWFFPTFCGALWLAHILGTKTIIWNESNLEYVEYSHPFVNRIRTFVLDHADAYAVPGQWAKEYLRKFAPSSKDKSIVQLTNSVDDARYVADVQRLRTCHRELRAKWNVPVSADVVLSVLRLEPIKGVDQMLQGWIQSLPLHNAVWLIAGDGSLQRELQRKIRTAGLESSVRLLGHRSEEDILELLAISDIFALPSLGDPYPLAVIEAMFAGLPLLLSDRVGCHPEALEVGKNGLLCDPYDVQTISDALRTLLHEPSEKRKNMGKRSFEIAVERFESRKAVQSFVDELLNL